MNLFVLDSLSTGEASIPEPVDPEINLTEAYRDIDSGDLNLTETYYVDEE